MARYGEKGGRSWNWNPGKLLLELFGEPGHCRARTKFPSRNSRGIFLSNYSSIAQVEMSNTQRWLFGPLKYYQWGACLLDPKKCSRKFIQRIFALGNIWGCVCRFAATPLIVPLSMSHSLIARFLPWSPIATGKYLDRTNKFPSFHQTNGSTDASNSP